MKRILTSLLVAGLGLTAHSQLMAAAPTPADLPPMVSLASAGLTPKFADQVYGEKSAAQRFDVYLPANGNSPYPMVMFIHGGGFRMGDKTMVSPAIVKGLLDAGYAVISTNYRLSTEATFPAAPQDIGLAIEFLRNNADQYDVNPDQLIVMGESAGANLAALSGTAAANGVLRGALLDRDSDIRPQGVVALYPPVDFQQLDSLMQEQGCENPNHNAADSFESLYLGGAITSKTAEAEAANPVSHIDSRTPPFMIENGNKDCQIGSAQASLLVNALKGRLVPVSYTQLDGAGHGGPEFETSANISAMTDWMRKTLGN